GVEAADTLPSPANDAAAVEVRPLASVTVRVSVSPASLPSRGARTYLMSGSMLSVITVEDDDHLYVYGAVPPPAFASAETAPPLVGAESVARGPAPATAGTCRLACVPRSVDGLHV